MKTSFKQFLPAVSLIAFSACAMADGWTTHYADAVTKAQANDEAVLLDFTGSDWCPWCQKMDEETLKQPDFLNFAKGNIELVTLDFPNAVAQSETVKRQNAKLKEKYNIQGFPTFILLSKDGTVLWQQVGYLAGGPQAFMGAIRKHYHHTAAAASTGDGDDFDSLFKKPSQ